ncbi:275_t:CDS:2, partial [Cetraspora pellucida]
MEGTRKRAIKACEGCRRLKKKCEGDTHEQNSCKLCVKRNIRCSFLDTALRQTFNVENTVIYEGHQYSLSAIIYDHGQPLYHIVLAPWMLNFLVQTPNNNHNNFFGRRNEAPSSPLYDGTPYQAYQMHQQYQTQSYQTVQPQYDN